MQKKKNLLKGLGLAAVDYKDTGTLRVFISERGKIRSRRVTGLTVQQQPSGGHGDQERSRDGAFALSRNRIHMKRKPLRRLAFAIR